MLGVMILTTALLQGLMTRSVEYLIQAPKVLGTKKGKDDDVRAEEKSSEVEPPKDSNPMAQPTDHDERDRIPGNEDKVMDAPKGKERHLEIPPGSAAAQTTMIDDESWEVFERAFKAGLEAGKAKAGNSSVAPANPARPKPSTSAGQSSPQSTNKPRATSRRATSGRSNPRATSGRTFGGMKRGFLL
ncbi:hypothetical protein Bbelb_040290 [Branchiostoma belcheri]|nr:hypothetical protein Bbelb_040290 [Branchiostoma belcheri]